MSLDIAWYSLGRTKSCPVEIRSSEEIIPCLCFPIPHLGAFRELLLITWPGGIWFAKGKVLLRKYLYIHSRQSHFLLTDPLVIRTLVLIFTVWLQKHCFFLKKQNITTVCDLYSESSWKNPIPLENPISLIFGSDHEHLIQRFLYTCTHEHTHVQLNASIFKWELTMYILQQLPAPHTTKASWVLVSSCHNNAFPKVRVLKQCILTLIGLSVSCPSAGLQASVWFQV